MRPLHTIQEVMFTATVMLLVRQLLASAPTVASQTNGLGQGAKGIYAQYASAVVTIKTRDGSLFPLEQGSGFVTKIDNKNGSFVLTNFHVIFRAGLILVETRSGETKEAVLCYFDEPSDIALLRVATRIDCNVPFRAEHVEVGSEVFALGAPESLGWTISNGIVSALRNIGGIHFAQFTAAVSPGSSGGPLFDTKGNLIGITSFKARRGENLNFAIRLDPAMWVEIEKNYWEGIEPCLVGGLEWCVGHLEQDQTWIDRSEKAKTWNALTTIITELTKKQKTLAESASDRDRIAALRERSDAGPSDRRLRHPLNIAEEKLHEAYANRYEEFPQDPQGWIGAFDALNAETDLKTMRKLASVATKKWPHHSVVVNRIAGAIWGYSPSTPNWDGLIKYLDDLVAAVPSKSDIELLPRSENLGMGKIELNDLLETIRYFSKLAKDGNPDQRQLLDRVDSLNHKLSSKDW